MKKLFTNVATDESGAVTVDWVMRVAAVFSLCVVVFGAIQTGAIDLTDNTADYLGEYDPFTG